MKTKAMLSALALAMLGNFAHADQYYLNLSAAVTSQDPMVIAMEAAAERIAERTDGQMTVRVFPSSQLGSDEDVIEQIRSGANIGILVDAGRLSQYKSELGILSAPYLVDDYTQYEQITSSDLYLQWVEDLADDSGLRLLNYNWFQGSREMLTKEPVEGPDDLRGVRVRTINSPVWMSTIRDMGATPTPLPWTEVYSALQLGSIDGAEAQLTAAEGQNLHEVVNHIALTGHIQLLTGIATSEEWYQGLPSDFREIVYEELLAAGEEASQATVDALDAVRARMEDAGVTFRDVDIDVFRDRVSGVYEELGYDQYRDELTSGL
ncbi:C4-dicarboxylate ABC transporter [Natronospirillum operosum]|uniref:C4-dicarboxylate ABC transporter n=1 Tax=Natronospirillum operosum TaxID=2759953 RepID=A0A4Z0WE47_9GAMM|nr:C4-dicarboxylate TRAP transporter substrate-binding protein [Natronospirillum operosum]TGG93522.1 C4-dicarboxylate ABC transporter [Natronospirillum operosum]